MKTFLKYIKKAKQSRHKIAMFSQLCKNEFVVVLWSRGPARDVIKQKNASAQELDELVPETEKAIIWLYISLVHH